MVPFKYTIANISLFKNNPQQPWHIFKNTPSNHGIIQIYFSNHVIIQKQPQTMTFFKNSPLPTKASLKYTLATMPLFKYTPRNHDMIQK